MMRFNIFWHVARTKESCLPGPNGGYTAADDEGLANAKGAMKKKQGIARAVAPMGREALTALPTGALLARLERLRWCEEKRTGSDLTSDEIDTVSGKILFKDDPAWKRAYRDVKAVLDAREHVDKKRDRR